MARYNEILVGRYARGVQKLFGMKGEVPVGSLAGELSVTHNVFNGVENRYLEGWERFSFSHFFAAVAAQNQAFQVRNPANSNMIAAMEKITISTGLAQELTVFLVSTNTDLTSLGTPANMDTRGRGNSTAVGSFQATSPAFSRAIWDQLVNANTPVDVILFEDQEIPLLPGVALQVATNTVNSSFAVSMHWRERFLEESERA